MLLVVRSGSGLHSPFSALYKFGSYRGFICRACDVARSVGFDPARTWPVQRNRGAPYACLREVSSDSMTTGFYPAPSAKVLMSGCHTLNATNAVRSSDLGRRRKPIGKNLLVR